ncbi:MAG: dioxygenase family protein [Alphaproteobacteria bacterium]
MRTVTKDTITEAFMAYCGPDTSPRLQFILERFVHHLHDFTKEVGLTHEEWRKAIELLMKAGEISGPDRNEFVLFSDVLGLSSLVDMINSPADATPSSVLGPFHILGAPELPVGGDLRRANTGETVIIRGQVIGANGTPIPGAKLELWQIASNGLYSNLDPEQPDYNLRAHMTVGDEGVYAFTTVRPAPYTVPDDGPVGELLHATGRQPWRPSHLHVIATAAGYTNLVTELFPDDDEYLDQDAVFGVREGLITHYKRHDDVAASDQAQVTAELSTPYYTVDFDLQLSKRI